MNIQLIINEIEIPLDMGGYKEVPQVKEERQETEAGTIHRNIARSGIGHIEVSLTVDDGVKAYLDECVCADFLTVKYYSEVSSAIVEKYMFIEPSSYDADLIVENEFNRFYKVKFSLEEF